MPYDTTAPPPPLPTRPRAIAPWLHTAALFFVLAITTFAGHTRAASSAFLGAPRIPRYTSSIVAEWLLLGSVIAGIYVRRDFFLTTLKQRTHTLVQTLGFGAVIYLFSVFALGLVRGIIQFTSIPHSVNLDVILGMAPRTPAEFTLWFFLSLSAGVCEELIFRGYLMQQLTAWTTSPVAAILITGILFGCVHLYEGLGAILPLATLGIVYGFATRYFKGDLRPVIVAHFLQDFLVAFIAQAARHLPHPPTL